MRFLPQATTERVDLVAQQAEQRERRRKHLTVTYGEGFDLLSEVYDLCQPLAERVAAEPRPVALRQDVDDLAEAVHSLCVAVHDLIAAADARRRTAHLGPRDRPRALRALAELAERPRPPEVTDAMLGSGLWVHELCELAGPLAGTLSDLLAHAVAPGTRRGLLSPSEVLVEALRPVDRAAVSLERHLHRAELSRAQPRRRPAQPDPRAELQRLGVQL